MHWTDALELCNEILLDAEDVPERGTDFAASVCVKVESMQIWIAENECVTEAMLEALHNMHAGVKKWLH